MGNRLQRMRGLGHIHPWQWFLYLSPCFCSCLQSLFPTKSDLFENLMLIIPSVCSRSYSGFHLTLNTIHTPILWPLTIVQPHLPLLPFSLRAFLLFLQITCLFIPLGLHSSFLLQYSLSSHFLYMSIQLSLAQRGLP